jgi:tetratricopeptide (TPR) repeat protein
MNRWQIHRRAEDLLDLRRPVEAEQLLRDHLADDAEDAAALILLGQALHHRDRLVRAERVIRSALRLEPEMHHGYLVLTDVLVDQHDILGAERAAKQAIRLGPEQWTSHYSLARTMVQGTRPRYRDALEVALHAVNLAPHSAMAHNMVGICLNGLNDRAQARSAFEEALRLDPQQIDAAANLAALDAATGKLRRGTQRITAALSQEPTESALHEALDHLVFRFCFRLFFVVVVAGVVVGIEVAVEAPWLVRSGTGVLLMLGIAWMLHGFARHLPRGMTRWGRESIQAIRGEARGFFWVLALAVVTLVLLSFAPASVASAVGIPLIRITSAAAISGLILGAFTSLVRGR